MSQAAPTTTILPHTSPQHPSTTSSTQSSDASGFLRQLQTVQGQPATESSRSQAESLASTPGADGIRGTGATGRETSEEASGHSGTVLESLVGQVLAGNPFLHLPPQQQAAAQDLASASEEGLASALAALQATLEGKQGTLETQALVEVQSLLQQLQSLQGQTASLGFDHTSAAAAQQLLEQLALLQQGGASGAGQGPGSAEVAARLRQLLASAQSSQGGPQNGQGASGTDARSADSSQAWGQSDSQIQSFLSGARAEATASPEAAIVRALQQGIVRAEGGQEALKNAPWQQLASFASMTSANTQGEQSLSGLMQQNAEQGLMEQGQSGQQLRQALAAMLAEGKQKSQAAAHGAQDGAGQARSSSGQGGSTHGNGDSTPSTGFGEQATQANRVVQTGGGGRAYQGASAFETQILDQIRVRVQSGARQGQSEIVVRMRPPELGEVRLNLTSEDGILRAHLHAQSQQVHDVLERHAPQLRQALAEQGIDLDDVLVSSDDAGGQESQSEWQTAEDGASRTKGQPEAAANEDDHDEQYRQARAAAWGSRAGALSLRI